MSTCPEAALRVQICARYRKIERTRMAGLPMLNPALEVACFGFERQGEPARPLGVLVTPWCMNLMLLPGEDDDWARRAVGEKQMITLPSGHYEFIHAEDAELGRFASCSLFSPMAEFEDQAAAEATAEAVLAALFADEHRSENERDALADAHRPADTEADGTLAAEQAARPATLSRRGFLTGGRSA